MEVKELIADYQYQGLSADGVRRVWGRGYGKQQAADECLKAAETYVRGRPDTGPLSDWSFVVDAYFGD